MFALPAVPTPPWSCAASSVYMEIEYTTEKILKDIIKILNIRQSQISKKSINELLKEVKK